MEFKASPKAREGRDEIQPPVENGENPSPQVDLAAIAVAANSEFAPRIDVPVGQISMQAQLTNQLIWLFFKGNAAICLYISGYEIICIYQCETSVTIQIKQPYM